MKPVHGDTVSNDSSSSAWCSYSNQSGLSFRRLSSLQGAKTDRILHEKYIPLKENNLLEKLVKTRVLYEELRRQILSSSLSTSSKGNLISGTQPLVVGKHRFKANKSKIIQLVDLVDKGVILRPEKLCECCASSNYNSETRYEYGPKERRQRQIHTGGYLTSKSSIISKKKTIGESRLEIRFKTKNIKSDPCTFKFKEFMKQKSREALKRNPAVHPFNIDGIINKKSNQKLKQSKPHLVDGVRLSVTKIKQKKQPIKDIKKPKSIAKKSLETIINQRHFVKVKPCCCSNVIQNTSITHSPIKIVQTEFSHQTSHSNSKFDVELNQNSYLKNWNYNLGYPPEMSLRDCFKKGKHRRVENFLAYLPCTSDVKVEAENNTNKELETSKSFKNIILANHTDNYKILEQNENHSVLLGVSQMIKSKENSSLVLQGQNSALLATKISKLLTSSKRSIPLLSIDSIPKTDSGLLTNETKCKTLRKSIKLGCRPEVKKSGANINENLYKNINMSPTDFCTDCQIKVLVPYCTVLKNNCLYHSKHSNSCQNICRKSSNINSNLSNYLVKSIGFSEVEKQFLTRNKAIKPDSFKHKIQSHASSYNKSIIDTSYVAQHHKEKRNFDRKLHAYRQKRISKSVKNGSLALKRCFCTLKLKAMNINNGRETISYVNDLESIQSKTFIKIKKRFPCELFLCASGEYVSSKCDSWKIQYHTGSKLTSKSLTALEQYGTITNLLQVKTSHFVNCRIARNHKNIVEDSWLVQYKKSETGCSLDKTKYQSKKHCSHNCFCSFNQTKALENNIYKTTKLSRPTIVPLDHIVGPKMVSEVSELVVDDVPSLTKRKPSCYFKKIIFNNPITGIVVTDDEKPITPSVKRRKTKSGIFRSQPIYKLLKTKKVQSSIDTFNYSYLINNNEINRNRQSESQEMIGSDSYCSITNLCTHNIIHENPEYFNKKHANTLKSSWKDSLLSRNYKLIKIQKHIYLIINSSSKPFFSTLKLQKSNCVINNNAVHKHKYLVRNIGNVSKYCEEKNNRTELFIKPKIIQVHADKSQRSNMYKCLEKSKYRRNETVTREPQNNYESNSSRDSKTVNKSAKYGKKYKGNSENVKNHKNLVSNNNLNSVKNPQNLRYFVGKSSSIISVSSTIAIKSKTLQSYYQSHLKFSQLKSTDPCKTLQINSKFNCEVMKCMYSRKKNVKTQFRERSLDIKPCEVRPLNSIDAIIHSSQIVKPVNPHLTGISSLLRRCFCTMNLQVGDGRESSKFRYKLKPYECAPYDCVPYECDPYECQKRIVKRLVRKVSSTDTEKMLGSSANETLESKKHQSVSVSMSEPKKSKPHRKVICDCRSTFSPNVEIHKKKPHSKTSFKLIKNEGVRGDRIHKHIAHETQSSIRKLHNKSFSVVPKLKRCFCTVKLQKNKENNRTSDDNTISTSTQNTISTSKKDKVKLRTNDRGFKTQGYVVECKCPELITTRKKNAKDTRATDTRALSISSSLQVSPNKKKRSKYIESKKVHDKPVRSRELREQVRYVSTPSDRQAVKVGSSFSFSLEFYKDMNKTSVDQTKKTHSKETYGQENRKNKGQSPKLSSRNVISQTENITKKSFQNSQAPIRQEQTNMTGSFLKRCFCITKKRSSKKGYKYTSIGTQENNNCECKRSMSRKEYEGVKLINKRQSIDKASETEKYHPGFVPTKCECIQLNNKRHSIDKACECIQIINKKHHRNIGSGTEKHVTKSISSGAASSKTSKARILQENMPSSKIRQIKPILPPETVGNEETMEGSLHRQAVKISSNFSFDIEFYKDLQFPDGEKVQAAAEAIKETRDKMSDVKQMEGSKRGIGSSLYSLYSEINTPNKAAKGVGPMLRRCLCTLKLQEEKHSQQNNQSQLQSYKSKHSVHRGTVTPFSRPIPNFHNRGVMTVYKLKTYPYKLAPYECEPGVCIPGECDPYECLRRMNRRHMGSSTDGYSTKSALSMTRPTRRYRDNRVQFSPREQPPHTREGHTRSRPAPRPREGIEVRQKPRPNKTNRQAVKIGSNFSFNVEFYKDRSKGGGARPKPCPKPCTKPCPKPCPEACPKTCPKRFMNNGTDAASVSYRNKKAQRKRGQTHSRDSQVWGRKMRSTMTGVGPFLKRCFCTLQLQRRQEKELPHREERRDSDSSSIGTETARYRPQPHYREQGTRPRRHHRNHGRRLDPNECEPGVCIPGQCDPYVCLERIKRRGMHSRHAGTGGRHRMRSVSSSITDPGYRRHRNRSVSSSMMDYRRPHAQKTQMNYRPRRNERPTIVKERAPSPSSPTSHRQAVRIGSSFSFNIEFYKDRNQQAPRVYAPVRERREHVRNAGAPVRYIKRPVPVRRTRTDSTGSGPIPTRTRSMSSSYRNQRNRRMQAHSKTLLKRCFCTLKLQKIGTRQRQTQDSTASIGTYYKTAGAQIRQKQEIVPQYREFGTRPRRRRLEPYECEPGVCVPGQCDPYECLERIKRRNLVRHSGTSMGYPHTRSMSNLTPHYYRSKSMNTPMYRAPRKKYHRRYTESPRRIKQPPPRPSRALENIHTRQAVRLGSNFSFNVEFFKDRSGVTKEAPCRSPVCKEPTCSPLKCKTSSCTVSCPVKSNQRSRNIQYQGGGQDRTSQARSARTESRGSGVPLLKRCFCTLTLQRAEVNSYMIPLRARLYSEKSTSTKNKYFYSESEQQADLMSDYCGPDICMSECDPDYSVEPIKKRGLRRISRTTGTHMVRSRDISGGELGSRFMSFDMQPSKWYSRRQSERVETIVEEPRFQIFNRPNTKQTVRISSNYNFNIEFFKDIIFPEPCEVEEEFDEMSAVTEAIYPQHKKIKFREDQHKPSYEGDKPFYMEHKNKHKKIREPIYEGDKLYSIEHYRPKIRLHKTLTGKKQDEQRTKTSKELDEYSKKSKTEKEQDEHSKKTKSLKEPDEHSRKTKSLKEPDVHSKKSKAEKELDEHSIKTKIGKESDELGKKSKTVKEPDEHSKKTKTGKEAVEDIKTSEKTGGPINKIFKCLCVNKGNKCICPSDRNKCLCSTNGNKKYKCLCSTNANKKYKCLCSTNGNQKFKCLCQSTESNGKKKPKISKKLKGTQPENLFVNKAITIARMEMGFHKQKYKSSTTGMLPALRSSKYYLKSQPQGPKVTLERTNEIMNDLFGRNVLKLLTSKFEYGDSNATVCQVPVKKSTPKVLYLCSPKLFWTKSENCSEPCTIDSSVQSTTSLLVTKEKSSTKLLATKSEQRSKAVTLQTSNIFPYASSEMQYILSENNNFPIVTVSQSRKYINLENKSCSAEKLKTKLLNNHSFKADILSRIETKFLKQKHADLEKRQKVLSSRLPKSTELRCCKIKKIKNKISSSGLLLKMLCSSKLRKTKSEDVRKYVCNSITAIKWRHSKCYKSCEDLKRICFSTTQVEKTKPEQCGSVVTVARTDKSRPLSIFTPKEYWVQYQIQNSKLRKCRQDKQTDTHSESNKNQPVYAKLETILPYSPHKFRKIKSKMLFSRECKITCNNVSRSFCRSNCKLQVKRSSDIDNTFCSACQNHNQFCLNCDHSKEVVDEMFKTSKKFMIIKNELNIGTIKIQPWDPSRTNLKTLICRFLRALSSTKRIHQHRFVLKTSKHCINFTPAGLCSRKYKSSNDKCTFKTSFRKKYMTIKKYQRLRGNSNRVVNLTNSRRTGIKLDETNHGYCQAQRTRTCQQKYVQPSILLSKNNTDFSTSHVNEMHIFLVQSGSFNVMRKNITKQTNISKDTKPSSQTVVLSSPSLCSSSKSFNFRRSRDEFEITNSLKQQRKISSHSVKLVNATSNLINLMLCSNCNNYRINNNRRSGVNKYKKGFLLTKLNKHVFFQKLCKDRKKPCFCYICMKKCISRPPKLKNKIKSKYAIECRISPNLNKNSGLRDSETCVAKISKETTDTERPKRYAEVKPEYLEDLKQGDNVKKQVLINYNYHLLISKILICMHKMVLTNRKNTIGADNGTVFDPKRAYRHFKCILLNFKAALAGLKCSSGDYHETTSLKQIRTNFSRAIKDNLLRKPASKCLHSFKHMRKLHKRMLPTFLRARKYTVDLGFNALDVACPQMKHQFSIYYLLPRFYSHFITLARVWRQLIDVLLFVLWSPCLFSAQLCKAFLCCFMRFRLHCYFK